MADPLEFDPQEILLNARTSSTLDLLNRVTVYRAGMEPQAVVIIEDELKNRGVGAQEIKAHEEKMLAAVIVLADGIAARCSFCHQPAVARGWGWHRLWQTVPLFPRPFYYCAAHQPGGWGH